MTRQDLKILLLQCIDRGFLLEANYPFLMVCMRHAIIVLDQLCLIIFPFTLSCCDVLSSSSPVFTEVSIEDFGNPCSLSASIGHGNLYTSEKILFLSLLTIWLSCF